MANPINHAKKAQERAYDAVQPYMPPLFKRLAFNYFVLLFTVAIVNTLGMRVLLSVLPMPPSTANVIGFSVNLILLLFGWRLLEQRNKATGLFILYTRFSSQRRDLKATIENAEDDVLDDDNALYVGVDLMEEAAKNFLDAVENEGVTPLKAEA